MKPLINLIFICCLFATISVTTSCKSKCESCKGEGFIVLECSKCNGNSRVVCYYCHGTGEEKCTWCGGSGKGVDKITYSPNYTGEPNDEYCSICGYTTSRHTHHQGMCQGCYGKGYIEIRY